MKYINFYEMTNFNKKTQLLEYVIKINEIDFKKILNLPNAVVCLLKSTTELPIGQTIHFVNYDSKIIGRAKLVKLINGPKKIVWNEINKNTYLTKERFDEIYKNSELATISVVYDLCTSIIKEKMPISQNDFKNNIGFVILEK